jgi:hypothetical protein
MEEIAKENVQMTSRITQLPDGIKAILWVEKEENSLKAWLMKNRKKVRREVKKCNDKCDNKIRLLKKMIQKRKKAFMY